MQSLPDRTLLISKTLKLSFASPCDRPATFSSRHRLRPATSLNSIATTGNCATKRKVRATKIQRTGRKSRQMKSAQTTTSIGNRLASQFPSTGCRSVQKQPVSFVLRSTQRLRCSHARDLPSAHRGVGDAGGGLKCRSRLLLPDASFCFWISFRPVFFLSIDAASPCL